VRADPAHGSGRALRFGFSTKRRALNSFPPSSESVDVGETLSRGATLGRYVVVDVIGRGGMGVVYSAYDTQLDRRLAIKLLRRDVSRGDDAVEVESRMLREAQAMARLTHPNVVAVYDVGTFEHRVFLAMEYVDGWTLKTWLQTPRPWRERLAVLEAAGQGLAAAHAVGLVHRDFKPDNVLVGRDGRVLVTDFGLARIAGAVEAPRPSTRPSRRALKRMEDLPKRAPPPSPSGGTPLDAALTLTGSILGTVGYMAPEQAFGEVTNAATDQFSYCATAYVALYGERPFPGDDLENYLAAVNYPPREPPKGSVIPTHIRSVLTRGLSFEPEKRFASMNDLLSALSDDPSLRRRKWIAAVSAAALLGVGVLATTRVAARQGRECAVDPAELAGVWDPATKDDVRAAFARAGGPESAATLTRVEAVLDDVASRWSAMRGEVCEATYVRHQETGEVHRLRSECLDRRRTELRALTTVFRQADADVVKKSLDAAYGLTSVGFCADVQGLHASAGLPDDPAARARVLEARSELARANSLSLAGKFTDALGVAEQAVAVGRQSGHGSTIAEALYLVGDVKKSLGDYAGAEPALSEATWTAMAAGTDAVTARAAGLSAFVVGAKLRRAGEAHVWLGVAEGALAHLGGSEEIEADVKTDKAEVIAEADWHPEKALELDEEIVRTYRRLYGVHPKTARAIYGLGVDRAYLGEHAQAVTEFEQALAMSEAIGGPLYTEVGRACYGLGDSLNAQGEFARGDPFVERALAIFEHVGTPYWSAITLQVAIRSALAEGDPARAVAFARQALALMEKLPTTAVLRPIVFVPAADALMAAGASEEALALCDKALAEEEESGQLDPQKVLGWDALRCRGDALVRLGRAHEAIPLLERSLTFERRMYAADGARARFALARAISEDGGDASRARTLAMQARQDLSASPFLKSDIAAVDRWLATRAR
jgi:tetratricopeptide (TPR) repeat protein/predicted Ser/Thr protein kinase